MTLHAGLIGLRVSGLWRGVLIKGPSGAGKSDLALRCLEDGFRLVADDRVLLWRSGDQIWGRAPDPLRGLIEARAVGILAEPNLDFAPITLVASYRARPERLPGPMSEFLMGLEIPAIQLDFREDSASAKLRLALNHLGSLRQGAYLAAAPPGLPPVSGGEKPA